MCCTAKVLQIQSHILLWFSRKYNILHSIGKCCVLSEPESSLCDIVKHVLGHGDVAFVVLQEVHLVLDDRRVEALLCQRHLQLLKGPCYHQSVLPKAKKKQP